MNIQKAIVLGATGQDGSYMVELLLHLGYRVYGGYRRSSSDPFSRLRHSIDHKNFSLFQYDATDFSSLAGPIREIQPDSIFNLAAQSHVATSFSTPISTAHVTGIGALTLLEAVRQTSPSSKVYQASSSEMFGSTPPPQSAHSFFHPRSPYGVAKVFAFHSVVNYREAYGVFASNGILFNHESPRRGENFVTRKIAKGLVEANRSGKKLLLGNLEARRDWGYAPEYVVAMWRMLELDQPGDFVVGTGQQDSVRDFVDYCGQAIGVDAWEHVVQDKSLIRPSEVDSLMADVSSLHKLGWQAGTKAKSLAEILTEHEKKQLLGESLDVIRWEEVLSKTTV
jgi:GDPmannose 4,6-dehydratase